MRRYADHIASVFGRGDGQLRGYCGHEEIELALVKLARVTGERKYLDLAKFFVDERGQEPHFFTEEAIRDGRDPAAFIQKTYEYNQAHLPVRQQTKVVGHAVRAMYLYSGMADIATEYRDDSLTAALETLWDDLTTKQMYVTGGIGPSAFNEGFTDYYDLPNESAYAETCAAVGLVFWASRMLGPRPEPPLRRRDGARADNGAMSGLSRDGRSFFYENPLESAGHHHRWTWHSCPCCPPNIARLIASIGAYMYAVAEDEIAAAPLRRQHRPRRARRRQGRAGAAHPLSLGRRGAAGGDGRPAGPLRASRCASPAGPRAPALAVNGAGLELGAVERDGYARIEREWRSGDRVDLDLPLVPRALWANPLVRQDAGRVALVRGPLVYCLEGADCGAGLNAIALDADPAAGRHRRDRGARRGGRARPGRSGATPPTGAPRSTARRRPPRGPTGRASCPISLGQPRARGDAGLGALRRATLRSSAGLA